MSAFDDILADRWLLHEALTDFGFEVWKENTTVGGTRLPITYSRRCRRQDVGQIKRAVVELGWESIRTSNLRALPFRKFYSPSFPGQIIDLLLPGEGLYEDEGFDFFDIGPGPFTFMDSTERFRAPQVYNVIGAR